MNISVTVVVLEISVWFFTVLLAGTPGFLSTCYPLRQ